jgi:uncharacterized protein YlxW (UPF0749 family)
MTDVDQKRLPARVTMPLLTLITQQSLDEDYLHAAERRVQRGTGGPPQGRPRRTAAVVLVVFGVLVTTAAVQTNRNADVESAGRASLITRVLDQRASGVDLQDRIGRLRERNTAQSEAAATTQTMLQALQGDVATLQVTTGYAAVRGPGVRITVDDPERGAERIRKEDLFLVINGLWEAGAEAIALNGHRLSVLTSINNSDVAINVDSSALLPPYTLTAIGDVATLGADLLDTSTFLQFDQLSDRYGFRFDMDNEDSIDLPAAREERLLNAEAMPTDPDRRTDEGTTP